MIKDPCSSISLEVQRTLRSQRHVSGIDYGEYNVGEWFHNLIRKIDAQCFGTNRFVQAMNRPIPQTNGEIKRHFNTRVHECSKVLSILNVQASPTKL